MQESWYPIMSLSIKSRLFCGRREELQGGKKKIETRNRRLKVQNSQKERVWWKDLVNFL